MDALMIAAAAVAGDFHNVERSIAPTALNIYWWPTGASDHTGQFGLIACNTTLGPVVLVPSVLAEGGA